MGRPAQPYASELEHDDQGTVYDEDALYAAIENSATMSSVGGDSEFTALGPAEHTLHAQRAQYRQSLHRMDFVTEGEGDRM